MNIDPIHEWIVLADQDEASARFLLDMRPKPLEVICFHCQQSVEKSLKALMAKQGMEIPRTHDLLELLDMVVNFAPDAASLESMLLNLNDFSVVVRYPSHVSLEEQDAIKALEAVNKIRNLLFKHLSLDNS